MVNSVNTVLEMWRGLVKEADLTILAKKRHKEPIRADKLRLRFHNYKCCKDHASRRGIHAQRATNQPKLAKIGSARPHTRVTAGK
jgi:hypothetical protein